MKTWACDNFKASNDPYFCANCGDLASMHEGPTPGAPRTFCRPAPREPTDNDQIARELAERFLRWPLPDGVCARLCAGKQGPGLVGTNLLSYDEARQMMQEVVISTLREKGMQL
jgi:hypothetical protein